MADAAKPTLAERIDEIIRDAMGDVIADAREEGWRAGYSAGRIEARREMNGRLRALILDEDVGASIPQPADAGPVDCSGMHALIDEVFGPERQDTGAGVASTDAGPPAGELETAPQAGDEPHAPNELPIADAADAPVAQADADEDDAEETAAAVPAAAPQGPRAEPALNQAPPPPQQDSAVAPSCAPRSGRGIKGGASSWRTPEREVVMRKHWPGGTLHDDVVRLLEELPGGPVPRGSGVGVWAADLGLRRPPGFMTQFNRKPRSAAAPPQPAPARPAQPAAAPSRERPAASHPSILPPGAPLSGVNPKAAAIPLPKPHDDGKVYTSFHNIRAWAGIYGIAYDGSNMDRVNKLRAAKSLPLLLQDET